MTVVDDVALHGPSVNPRQPLEDAIGIVDACLTAYAGQRGRIFERLTARRDRLVKIRDAPPRPGRDPDKAVNRRASHAVTLGRAPV